MKLFHWYTNCQIKFYLFFSLCVTATGSHFAVFYFSGSMREIDVIDVSRQEDCKMLMREWTDYYNSTNRSKVYNVISLEFSKTK